MRRIKLINDHQRCSWSRRNIFRLQFRLQNIIENDFSSNMSEKTTPTPDSDFILNVRLRRLRLRNRGGQIYCKTEPPKTETTPTPIPAYIKK